MLPAPHLLSRIPCAVEEKTDTGGEVSGATNAAVSHCVQPVLVDNNDEAAKYRAGTSHAHKKGRHGQMIRVALVGSGKPYSTSRRKRAASWGQFTASGTR